MKHYANCLCLGVFLGLITFSGANAQTPPPVIVNYQGVNYTVSNAAPANSPNTSFDSYFASHPTTALRIDGGVDNGTYDCHAFAWANRTDIWIQTSPPGTNVAPQIYYSQFPIYETSSASDAEIVVYGDATNYPVHSALHLTNATASSNAFARKYLSEYPQYAGWWISKWDGGPLAIHTLTSCPFYISQVTYYKKNGESGTNYIEYKGSLFAILGPNIVCRSGSGASFELMSATGNNPISSLPTGFSVNWTGSSNISFSPSASAYPVTVNSAANGPGEWVKATITFPDGSTDTVTRSFVWSGVPAYVSSISTSQWTAGGPGYMAITVNQSNTELYGWPFNTGDVVPPNGNLDSHGASSYNWTCSGLTYTQNPALSAGYRYTQGGFSGTGAATMTINASNTCGSTSNYQALNVTSGGYSYALFPNPASSQVTVNVTPGAAASTGAAAVAVAPSASPATYTIRVVDGSGVVRYTSRKTGNSFTIPVSSLKAGNYEVELSDGKTVSGKPLLIVH
ncbi:MAG TPA: T9SS type A sorting domain-containing protein [Puia sp.]|nr:T9SS type A sorting domain-containing protein [Puia sp.]